MLWQNIAHSSERWRPGREASLWFCWYYVAGGKFFQILIHFSKHIDLGKPLLLWWREAECVKTLAFAEYLCCLWAPVTIMNVQRVPLPGLPSWVLTPAPPLLCVAEGPPWATDLPRHVDTKWLQSGQPGCERHWHLQFLFFFLEPQVWEYYDSSKNHIDK